MRGDIESMSYDGMGWDVVNNSTSLVSSLRVSLTTRCHRCVCYLTNVYDSIRVCC